MKGEQCLSTLLQKNQTFNAHGAIKVYEGALHYTMFLKTYTVQRIGPHGMRD